MTHSALEPLIARRKTARNRRWWFFAGIFVGVLIGGIASGVGRWLGTAL